MKAFLSHSSKDKSLVRQIADELGPARCEYDEYSFEYTLTAQAIRQAFARADLFVLFLSENSTKSTFVNEEIRTALDLRAQGTIKKVIIFPLDATSYRELPDWLRATNVVIRLQNPFTIFRKIEAELFALEAENFGKAPILIPREEEEQALRTALSLPPGQSPVALHIVGHIGIGRRTLLGETLKRVFPRKTLIPIVLGQFEGANEFYRRLYELFVNAPIDKQIEDFEKFAAFPEDQQVERLADLCAEIAIGEEFVLVDDQGGVYTDEGQYHSYLQKLIQTLKGASSPFLGIAQTRMMPLQYREENKASFHLFLNPMTSAQISQLASFSLREIGVDYSASQIADVCALLDGNPINVKLAMKAIHSYGLSPFIADPSLLVEWKRRRAEDFLSKIEFTNVETELMAILFDYRFVTFEILRGLVEGEIEELTAALRKLEEFCCVERRGVLYVISAPIHDAIGRDKRFQKPDGWKRDLALKIIDLVSQYREEDRAPVALFEAAAMASLISGKPTVLVARYILPSYYLTLAQRAYNEVREKHAIEFCKLAWERKDNLSVEGRIEVLRIWGLSGARLRDKESLQFALKELSAFSSKKVARRHKHFLEGFSLRLRRKYDDAEAHFLEAYELSPRNLSINRELANLYRHRREFIEGEGYARAAHAIAPTNPFILDIFLECLLGKTHSDLPVDQGEITNLLQDLAKYGDVPGSSFYQTRIAQDLFRQKNPRAALAAASKAVERTADFLPCRYLRAEIYLALSNSVDARKDLDAINGILEKRGGFSEDDEGKAVALEVRILTEERNFKAAREKLNNSQFLPHRVATKLAFNLAKAIRWEPDKADQKSKEWAGRLLNQ